MNTILKFAVREIRELWDNVLCSYDECKNYLKTSETDSVDGIEKKYSSACLAYLRCLSTINKQLDHIKSFTAEICSSAIAPQSSNSPKSFSEPSVTLSNYAKATLPPGSSSSESFLPISVQSVYPPESSANNNCSNPLFDSHYFVVPPIDIEIFAGDFISWPTFRDLFTTFFVKNARLSNVEAEDYR